VLTNEDVPKNKHHQKVVNYKYKNSRFQ